MPDPASLPPVVFAAGLSPRASEALPKFLSGRMYEGSENLRGRGQNAMPVLSVTLCLQTSAH